MTPPDSIQSMVQRCRAGEEQAVVARLQSGWVVLAQCQVLDGYCLLLPDPVVDDLNALGNDLRAKFLTDMAAVGDALLALTGAVRINYAIYGNVDPVLHAHVFPRFASEPQATRTAQPFALDWAAAPRYSVDLHGDLQQRLHERLQGL
jgi:diadenosine tetraphosphate (Ap4A) HIT family hydrolase